MRPTSLDGARNGRALALGWAASLLMAAVGRAEPPLRQRIDAEIGAVHQRLEIKPSGLADDATFLRRVYLDLVGAIPTYEEAKDFLDDANADKRSKLIDRLLDDPRFARQQAAVWDLLLLTRNSSTEVAPHRPAFRKWLTEKFAKNEPYDRWVRQLLLAEGASHEDGTPLFYLQFRAQPDDVAMAVSRLFLATQLQCAQCHDDRRDAKWKQTDFYGFAAFFARLTLVEGTANGKSSPRIGEKSSGEMMFTGPAADQVAGKKGKPIAARFLDGPALDEPPLPKDFKEPDTKGGKPVFSRKEKLAEWVTAADNPFFARAVANRVWGQFLGRGQIHPVDDLREGTLASHPELFEALHTQLVQHHFDLKWYIRELVNSETYQQAPGKGEGPPLCFERARVRPLTPEEMLSALRTATGFDAAVRAAGNDPDKATLPNGLGFWIPRVFNEGPPGSGFQISLQERLFVNNSGRLNDLLKKRKGNLVDSLLSSTESREAKVDRLYLSVLTRLPRPEERQHFVAYLSADPKEQEARIEEALWTLLASSEFRFNR